VGFGSTDRFMLIALIRLYANTHAPAYHVVVGDVAGAENVGLIAQKQGLTDSELVNIRELSPKLEHWVPQILPLPFWSSL
jgi:hypothetical protein